jgi:hypothetical protein
LIVPTPSDHDPLLLKFDENGNASIRVNNGAFQPLTGALGTDPSVPAAPGNPPVLIYNLPLQVVSGDVRILEPLSTNGELSDALRFTTLSGAGKGVIDGSVTGAGRTVMIYYSDFVPGDPDDNALADTGFPSNLGTGLVTSITEVGPEGHNGFDYLPAGVPFPANNEYIGISDSIPEAGTWAMMIVGFVGLSFAGFRKAKSGRALA